MKKLRRKNKNKKVHFRLLYMYICNYTPFYKYCFDIYFFLGIYNYN